MGLAEISPTAVAMAGALAGLALSSVRVDGSMVLTVSKFRRVRRGHGLDLGAVVDDWRHGRDHEGQNQEGERHH